jgi:deoxyhypusine synthase
MSDEELFEKGYNRVYDTLEMEANLNYVEEFSRRALDTSGEQVLSSEIVCRALGRSWPRTSADRACCAAPTRRACPSTSPPSPTPSSASTSRRGR